MAMQLRNILLGFILSGLIITCPTAGVFAQKNKKESESLLSPKPIPETKEAVQAELIEAMQERIIGNVRGALVLFESFTKKHPEIAAGHYELGETYYSNKQYTQALNAYSKAMELDPKNKWFMVRMAEMYDFLKMFKESKDIYKKLAAVYPNELEFALSAMSILVDQGQLDEAIDVLTKVESVIGVTETINMEKYRLYMSQKKYAEALKELEKLQVQYPGETLYTGMAAEVYYAKGDKKKALESYQKILQKDSNNTIIHLAIADYYQKEKDLDNAFYHLEKAFENRGVSIDKKVMILLSFLEQSNTSEIHQKEAAKLNKLLTEVHPESPKSWSIAGDYALGKNNWREALDNFEKVIEIDPSKFIFFHQAGLLAIRLEDYQSLEKLANTGEEMYPMQAEIFLFKGIYLTKNAKYTDAEEALNYGKELVVENPLLASDFESALGVLYAAKREASKSTEHFEKSIQIAPNNYWAYQQYAANTSPVEKAKMLVEKSIGLSPKDPEGYVTKANILLKNKDLAGATQAIEKSMEYGAQQIKSALLLYADILEQNGNTTKASQIRAEANAI